MLSFGNEPGGAHRHEEDMAISRSRLDSGQIGAVARLNSQIISNDVAGRWRCLRSSLMIALATS